MLRTMRRIVQEVNAADSLAEALQIVVERIRSALETHACSVFLLDPDTNELVLHATVGLNESLVGEVRLDREQGLVGLVASRAEPINLDDATTHPNYCIVPTLEEEQYHAFLGVPIINKRRLHGVLVVEQSEPRRYDEAEEAFVATIATQLAAIIVRAGSVGGLSLDEDPNPKEPLVLEGIASMPGIGIGYGVVVYPKASIDAVPERQDEADPTIELERFQQALQAARDALKLLSDRMAQALPPEEQALFEVYVKLLEQDSLSCEINTLIAEGMWAELALKKVFKKHIASFEAMEEPYFRERAFDIKDLGERILSHLQNDTHSAVDYPDQMILIGEEIPASLLAEVPHKKLKAIVSGTGSSNSHVAILARAMGVPTVMGMANLPIARLEKATLIVDGYNGKLFISPKKPLIKEYLKLVAEEKALDQDLKKLKDQPAETLDGYYIDLYVNTGLAVDVDNSLSAGSDGVGLYRTEIPFMIRESFPGEETQRVIYRQLLGVFSPRPVTMRMLDIGGDKMLPYFPITEANPFLGWRGIRVTLDHPDVFLVQARAMLRASAGFNNLRIMFPMITLVAEVDEALRLLDQAYREVIEEGEPIEFPQVGVMVEVPAAVFQIAALAQRVDFLSVGSNDLTQYILAADRNNSRVAGLYNSLNPTVLRALHKVVRDANELDTPVSICGEMAGEPAIAILLLAMGFKGLSMSAANLSRVKWAIRHFKMAKAKQLLEVVLQMDDPLMVKRYLDAALVQAGLGNLVHGGGQDLR